MSVDSSGKGFDWQEIIRTGTLAGLKPNEVWELELWEYNIYITAYEDRQKGEISNAILAGYYTAYYINGGKKAKSPNELIKQMYVEKSKQSFEEGLKEIERLN